MFYSPLIEENSLSIVVEKKKPNCTLVQNHFAVMPIGRLLHFEYFQTIYSIAPELEKIETRLKLLMRCELSPSFLC